MFCFFFFNYYQYSILLVLSLQFIVYTQIFDSFYISWPFMVPTVDHMNMNKSISISIVPLHSSVRTCLLDQFHLSSREKRWCSGEKEGRCNQPQCHFAHQKGHYVFMNVLIWAHCALHNYILHVTKFTTLTLFMLLVSCKLSLPTVNLKIYSVHILALKFLNRICTWVLWDLTDYLLYCLTETVFRVIVVNVSQGSIF